ncbi:MAG: hypothetical protein ACI9LO_001116 [Planctomycetota bacterium]|jgi:hypothetical protein
MAAFAEGKNLAILFEVIFALQKAQRIIVNFKRSFILDVNGQPTVEFAC